jgi:hypothetical protein
MRPSIASFLCHAQHGDRRGAGPGNYTSVDASAGKPVQLTYRASANKDCTPPGRRRFASPRRQRPGVLTVRRAYNDREGCGLSKDQSARPGGVVPGRRTRRTVSATR